MGGGSAPLTKKKPPWNNSIDIVPYIRRTGNGPCGMNHGIHWGESIDFFKQKTCLLKAGKYSDMHTYILVKQQRSECSIEWIYTIAIKLVTEGPNWIAWVYIQYHTKEPLLSIFVAWAPIFSIMCYFSIKSAGHDRTRQGEPWGEPISQLKEASCLFF